MNKIGYLIAPLVIAFAIGGTAQAADAVKPTSTCLTKIRSTFRLVDLYVKTDQVDNFIMNQIDITTRQCEGATDPEFNQCHNGLSDMSELAKADRGIEAHGRAQRAAPDCAAYMALNDQ
ncbi:hypothetical protein ACTU44_21740 (plasmid) [Thalassospira sp. SM2505]